MEYLKSREEIKLVRDAISTARKLEMAEYGIKHFKPEFAAASKAIFDTIGFELWQTDADGGKYFWRKNNIQSIQYKDRIEALKALLDEAIEWS